MKLRSLMFHWIPKARHTIARFPFSIGAAVVSMIITWIHIWAAYEQQALYMRMLLPALTGISLLTALAWVPVEAIPKKLSRFSQWRIWLQFLGMVTLVIFFISNLETPEGIYYHRFVQLVLASHLAVAIAPFIAGHNRKSFWSFNRLLLNRAILTFVYTFLLAAGYGIIAYSLKPLFGIDISDKWNAAVIAFICFPVSVIFFLTDFPAEPRSIPIEEYPKSLRILVPNVAFPLIIVYIALLYAYAIKIVATWNWPSGKVGWLIASLSFVTVLAYLLSYPIAKDATYTFSRWVSKNVFKLLIPLLVILFLAMYQRVHLYGLTEQRYALLLLATWMSAIAIYYSLKDVDIFWIPTSLLIIVLVTFIGPLSLNSVSTRSQRNRLDKFLTNHQFNEVEKKFGVPLKFEEQKDFSGLIDYICDHSGSHYLQTKFDVPGIATGDPDYLFRRHQSECTDLDKQKIATKLGIKYLKHWETAQANYDGFSIYRHSGGINSKSPDWDATPISFTFELPKDSTVYKIGKGSHNFEWDTKALKLFYMHQSNRVLVFELTRELLIKPGDNYHNGNPLLFSVKAGNKDILMIVNEMSGNWSVGELPTALSRLEIDVISPKNKAP